MKLSEREKQEDILFLDTVQQYNGQGDVMQLIQIVVSHFKFAYGGYNGYLENVSDLFDEIERYLQQPRL